MGVNDTYSSGETDGKPGWLRKNVTQIFPLLFSGVAVLVSLSTLYLTQLRPGAILISAGEAMQIWHNSNRELNVSLSVLFRNTGSQPLTINSLAMILKDPNSDDAFFMKIWCVQKLDQSKPGISLICESHRFTPITIPPREEVAKFVDFYAGPPGKNLIPKSTRYDIYILGWTRGQAKPDLKTKVQWSFDDEDIQAIKSNLDIRNRMIASGRFVYRHSHGGESRTLSLLEFKDLTE